MEIVVNGEAYVVPNNVSTIQQLVEHIGFDNPVIIAEHNGKILQQGEHENAEMKPGDTIEFVQFVGGG